MHELMFLYNIDYGIIDYPSLFGRALNVEK